METTAVSLIETGLGHITRREAEILHLMAQGHPNKEISRLLHISVATVQKHTKNIYRKLGVHNKIEAIQKTKWLTKTLFSNQN
jgi:LuxR family maltose regulon positive regulatory protein